MYEDAGRWGYLFQSYVLLTMMELHHKEVVSLCKLMLDLQCTSLIPRPAPFSAARKQILINIPLHMYIVYDVCMTPLEFSSDRPGEECIQCKILLCGEPAQKVLQWQLSNLGTSVSVTRLNNDMAEL